MIKTNAELICVRFKQTKDVDFYVEHKSIIEKKGFVWNGKFGYKPNPEKLQKIIDSDNPYLLLNGHEGLFLCTLEEFTYSKDSINIDEYPSYYIEKLPQNKEIKVWFKLSDIRKIDNKDFLKNFIVSSSKKPLHESMKRGMATHFFIESICDFEVSDYL